MLRFEDGISDLLNFLLGFAAFCGKAVIYHLLDILTEVVLFVLILPILCTISSALSST